MVWFKHIKYTCVAKRGIVKKPNMPALQNIVEKARVRARVKYAYSAITTISCGSRLLLGFELSFTIKARRVEKIQRQKRATHNTKFTKN